MALVILYLPFKKLLKQLFDGIVREACSFEEISFLHSLLLAKSLR